jgi:glutamate-5-semialdehyde dehydrogenase
MSNQLTVDQQVTSAASAYLRIRNADSDLKNRALSAIAEALLAHKARIMEVNQAEVNRAKEQQIAQVLVKRLQLSDAKFDEILRGLNDLVSLEDPVGKTMSALELDDGFILYQVQCPIGLIGVIFESRPDALVQIVSLCLKSGNAVILKGGSEAHDTNQILATIICDAIEAVDPLFGGAVQLIATREDVAALLKRDRDIQLIIPRGSNAFVQYIQNNTKIPVLGHADGICHTYVDADAEIQKAVDICYDAKLQYPAVCNAMETLLVDAAIAEKFLPVMAEKYLKAGVTLRGDERTLSILPDIETATDDDWATEYNDLVLSIKIIDGVQPAIAHINQYGSHHTDAIVTENAQQAEQFLAQVDSATVIQNASTRFADGFRFGKGAEVGISTNKIHARGPVGLDGLMIYQYRLVGSGNVVATYTGTDARRFTHRRLDVE